MHLILSHAASHRWPEAELPALKLPHLQQLLGRMHRVQTLADLEWERPHPLMPHERALAQALGWPDNGPWPWAARDTGEAGPQAWITPCHWQVGMDQVFMLDPSTLKLSDEESLALLQMLQPYLQEDGLQVRWHDALHWHACGELLGGWAAPSLDRVIGANVRPWITSGLPGALVRLQSEMQMLAYNHPVNDARLARGLLPVNAFWVHGAGRLPATPATARPKVRVMDDLRRSALHGDVQGWRTAWQSLDTRLPAPDTPDLQLTLCSESTAHHWQTRPTQWLSRLQNWLRPPNTTAALKALIDT